LTHQTTKEQRNESKKINVYGVEMSSFQEMKFAKYIDSKGISMNTLNKKERFNLADKWLKSNFNV